MAMRLSTNSTGLADKARKTAMRPYTTKLITVASLVPQGISRWGSPSSPESPMPMVFPVNAGKTIAKPAQKPIPSGIRARQSMPAMSTPPS